MEKLRIDKWLWAARFYKTRSIATDEVNLGRVHLGGQAIKPAREVRAGDTLTIWQARVARTVVVKAVSDQRGSATAAQQLYEETAESLELRAAQAEQRRLSPEPALTIGKGRPAKRDRRDLQKGWGTRWSASLD
jgi:ribosome-associated heat shock protein Hsp15